MSLDGTDLAATFADTVAVWNITTGNVKYTAGTTFGDFGSALSGIAIKDNKLAIGQPNDATDGTGTGRVLVYNSGSLQHTISNPNIGLYNNPTHFGDHIAINKDFIVVGHRNNLVEVIDVVTGNKVYTLNVQAKHTGGNVSTVDINSTTNVLIGNPYASPNQLYYYEKSELPFDYNAKFTFTTTATHLRLCEGSLTSSASISVTAD